MEMCSLCMEVYLVYIWRSCCCLVTKLCPTLLQPHGLSLPGSSVHRISQVRILEWVAISFRSRDGTHISCIDRWILYHWATRKVIIYMSSVQFSCSGVRLFAIPWTTACQVSLSITNSQSSPKLMSIESVMPSNHLILCRLPGSSPGWIQGFPREDGVGERIDKKRKR